MAGNDRRWLSKPPRPVLQKGHPLARGLVFAVCPWLQGASASVGLVDPDDRTQLRGDIQGSIPGSHSHWDMGITLAAGVSTDSTRWAQQGVRQASEPGASGQWTAAVLYRVLGPYPFVDNTPLFIKGDSSTTVNAFGFFAQDKFGVNEMQSFTRDALGSDGNSPSFNALWTSISSANRTYLQVASWVGNGTFPGQSTNESDMQTDGFVGTNAVPGGPNPVGLSQLAIQVFGDSGNVLVTDSEIGMLALWNRHMPKQAFSMLNTDPYSLWRPLTSEEAFQDEIAAAAFINACCCP